LCIPFSASYRLKVSLGLSVWPGAAFIYASAAPPDLGTNLVQKNKESGTVTVPPGAAFEVLIPLVSIKSGGLLVGLRTHTGTSTGGK